MRRLLLLPLLVLLAAGCGWFGQILGHTATQALGSTVLRQVPRWVKVEYLPKAALPGAELFATAGCTTCHSTRAPV